MSNLKCGIVVLACLLPFAANCQEAGVKSLRGKPSTEQIIEALNPGSEGAGKPAKTRGLSLGGSTQAAAPVAGWTRALDLEVKFQFNSDQLTGDGAEVVERLGTALQAKELSKVRTVTLEGHADASGDADYNVALSLRRAQAVRNVLAGKAGAPVEFKAIGKGANEPADPAHPTDPVNRRVRVIVGG